MVAFVHSGMGKFQNIRRDHDSTHQKKIQIQGPRPVADLIRSLTAMIRSFDLMKPGQKSLGVQIGFQEKRTIEERTLGRPSHRSRLVERTHTQHFDTGGGIEACDRGLETRTPGAEIRADRNGGLNGHDSTSQSKDVSTAIMRCLSI